MARVALLEWIGHKSLFSDPRVEYALLTDSLPPDALRLLRIAAGKRNFRVDKRLARLIGPRLPSGKPAGDLRDMIRTYQFGPGGTDRWGRPRPGYIQEVLEPDVRIILSSKVATEFRVVDVADDPERIAHDSRPLTEQLILPQSGLDFSMIRTTRVDHLRRLDDLLVRR